MKNITTLIAIVLIPATAVFGDIVIEQSDIVGVADYGTGQGQSFLLPPGATAGSIQLHIGSVGNDGGSIRVRLWEATGGPGSYFTRIGSVPVATGILDGSVVSGTPDWFTIVFDQPYTNRTSSSVYLVFEMELLTSGREGWNDYSYSNLNSYSGGHSVYWTGSRYAIQDGQDLTFRILDSGPGISVPQPRVEIQVTPASESKLAEVAILVFESAEGYDYSGYFSYDLSTPRDQWTHLDTDKGGYTYIKWKIFHTNLPPSQFFYVKVTKRN
jgi:hypothetical protein